MEKLKLLDRTFSHSKLGYCSDYQSSELFQWDRSPVTDIDTTVIYTDMMLNTVNEKIKNKIAWLIEPIEIAQQNYNFILKNRNKFDKILTHEKSLLDLGPPFEFIPFGGCWIKKEDQQIYKKSKLFSIIASNKNIASGHKLRHNIIANLGTQIDVYGRGWNEIENKLIGLKDYMFTIVVENCKRDYWFTEKLIDSFVTGTIPVYWGCPSIGDFFDMDGIIMFENINDLKGKLLNLTEETYVKMSKYIKNNFEIAKNYLLPDDRIFKTLNNE